MAMNEPQLTVDRNAPDPLFLQVRAHVLSLVQTGALSPGQALRPERQLARDLAVSRLTLRRALASLADAGLVQARVGKGWFVTSTVSEPPNTLMSFTRMVLAAGRTPGTIVVSGHRRRATQAEAKALERPRDAEIIDLRRLRLIDGAPVAFDHTRLAADSCPDVLSVNLEENSLYALLESQGVIPTAGHYTMTAHAADDELATLLDVRRGTPLLVLDQKTLDQRGRIFELVQTIYRVDRYHFRGTLLRAGVSPPDNSGIVQPGMTVELVVSREAHIGGS
jgi:GntR family transcriptional regulator